MLTAPVIRIVLDQATWIGFHLIALHDPFDSGFTVHDVLIRLIGYVLYANRAVVDNRILLPLFGESHFLYLIVFIIHLDRI